MMKLTTRLLKASTAWMAAVALTATAQAQSRDLQALVRAVSGSASYSVPGQLNSAPIRPGTRIPAGSTIRTAPGSSLDLFLGRGAGVVRLGGGTLLGLDKLSISDSGADVVSEIQLNLSQGELVGNVNRLSSGSHYEIKTPDGIAGIRGARYRINVPGGISVLDGTLVFVKEGTAHIVKGPGFYDPGTPADVRPLLPAEIPLLNQQFQGLDTNPGQTARQIPPPPPQQVHLSPVVGG